MASSSPHAAAPFLLLLLLQLCSWGVALPDQFVDPTCPQQRLPAALATVLPNYGGPVCKPPAPHVPVAVFPYDVDPVQFALNLEYNEAEFFLHGAYGQGLDQIAPGMAMGGPPPEFALQARSWPHQGYQAHGRRDSSAADRPQRRQLRQGVMDQAFGYRLNPPFDPYANSLNFLLACYVIPYLGINGYVGTNPMIDGYKTKELVAGLLGVEAGQDAVFRALLFERRGEAVPPYNITVAEFTDRVSALRNRLGRCGVKDEGLTVPRELGAEGAICTNVLSADRDSLSYARTPAQLLGILYLTSDERKPGGFYPEGANGKIARSFLGKPLGANESPTN
ncbi:unnamed protein product [Urochloa decumbens]|uniref:Desiccation-related protein PCC13-62 n=1 Tax=Urochloa decumbens TaxID=240449 RepID=A0ABC8WRN2_9POAL